MLFSSISEATIDLFSAEQPTLPFQMSLKAARACLLHQFMPCSTYSAPGIFSIFPELKSILLAYFAYASLPIPFQDAIKLRIASDDFRLLAPAHHFSSKSSLRPGKCADLLSGGKCTPPECAVWTNSQGDSLQANGFEQAIR